MHVPSINAVQLNSLRVQSAASLPQTLIICNCLLFMQHLLERMLDLLDMNETFMEDMQIRSPLLRKWLGAAGDTELWHRVYIIRVLDPVTQQMQYCLIQVCD